MRTISRVHVLTAVALLSSIAAQIQSKSIVNRESSTFLVCVLHRVFQPACKKQLMKSECPTHLVTTPRFPAAQFTFTPDGVVLFSALPL